LLGSTDSDTAMWAMFLHTSLLRHPWLAPTTPALVPADPARVGAYYAGEVTAMAVSPGGGRAVTGSANGLMRVWDLSNGNLEWAIESATGRAVRSLALLDYGSSALAGGDDGSLRIKNLVTGSQIAAATRHRQPVTSVVITSEETLALSGSSDGTLRLWGLPDLAERRVIRTGPVLCAAANSDGTVALTGGDDGGLNIWNLQTGARIITLRRHSGPIRALVMTGDEIHAVSVGEDGSLWQWALDGSRYRLLLDTKSGPLTSIAVTADTRRAVTGGLDGMVRVWDLAAEREIAHWRGDSAIVSCVLADVSPIAVVVGQKTGPPYRLELRN
jgi:WD40 repeat protein